MGDVPPHGSIRFKDREIVGMKPHLIARLGLGYVPENRDIFPVAHGAPESRSRPEVDARRASAGRWRTCSRSSRGSRSAIDTLAGVLSGGEQQMLTMCRTLMGDPDLIMIDEPTEGLAPMMVELVGDLLAEIAQARHFDPARRAEADDRPEDQPPPACDGARRDRLRRHAGRTCRQRGRPQGMARGLTSAGSPPTEGVGRWDVFSTA